jgi:hypothetical protein
MSTVSSRVALTMRTSIQRNTASTDDWGNPGEPDWEDHATDVPCYVSVQAGREPVSEDRTVVVEDMRGFVTTDTDVTEGDQLGDVTERGDVIYAGPIAIEAVLRYPEHKELMLRRIR